MNYLNLSEQVFESKCECCDEQQDFVVGDVVVSLCDGITSELFEVRELAHATYPEFIKCRPLKNSTYFCWLAVNEIRHATTAELKARKRLEAPVALFITEAL